ncbi:MAG: DUF262 domain-containing protein [Bacteroidales bacterium]|jgi:hypothetical protein|nr:DUF262 domain-containing protein [Bacteroidales bacterium]
MSKLVSGNTYSLKDIFSGENDKIIIPDLQRDYCWGNPYSKDSEDSLVDSFLDSVLSLFKQDPDKDITMGLIYGYYDELKPYHLQLCDGQQRLTTLFLIMGIINRNVNNRYRELLISNFELNEDDKDPHLLYGIRESSLYFLSDLCTHYFLDSKVSFKEIKSQYWFLNSYNQDPTILSILRALETITIRLKDIDALKALGDFLQNHLKFLFYNMNDRQNGEETFVVINTTGEPLSANQNLKPLIILENPDYVRTAIDSNGVEIEHDTANDWEKMETWFWKHRRLNDIDTSTEGMLAFLHCVRVLESVSEADWHHTIDISDDKFPITIKMKSIWDWFCAYKRIYELDYTWLSIPNIIYPDNQTHYTQKDLYSILPAMLYCKNNIDATDVDVQRIYHLFYNMGRYRPVTRSSQNEAIRVPAYRSCQLVNKLPSKDILSLLEVNSFDVDEEKTKLSFICKYKENESQRCHIEELFACAENFKIYAGKISTLVNWSELSIEKLDFFYNKIKELWEEPNCLNKLRRALLAYGVNDYPMQTGYANLTLCSDSEWRDLFEKQGKQIITFINNGRIDDIIASHNDIESPFYPLIHNESYLDFSKDHKIRVHAQGVIELMEKTKASANFLLFHRGQVFEKNMVDMNNWNGFWVWSDGNNSVFYSSCYVYNITLDMRIIGNDYQIVVWIDRCPAKPSIKIETIKSLGFNSVNGEWIYPLISNPIAAKNKFIELTKNLI